MLDKKEPPTGGTVANIANSVATGNSLNSSGATQSGGYAQNRAGQKPGFWRGDFAGNQNDNSNISNMFPVNFSFAELTSTLAQRGSEYFFLLSSYLVLSQRCWLFALSMAETVTDFTSTETSSLLITNFLALIFDAWFLEFVPFK